MLEKISSEYTIVPVNNGFVLSPSGDGDCGRIRLSNQIFVFESVDALAEFIQENFKDVSAKSGV